MKRGCVWLAAAALSLAAGAQNVPSVVNCTVSVTVIRCAGRAAPSSDTLRACRRPGDVWQALRRAEGVHLLYHSTREAAFAESGALEFVALERRPAILIGAVTATNNMARDYGMNLHLHARQARVADDQPLFIVDWDGSWSDSPQLIAKWESLAVRAFNVASKIPGIMYEKTEEDDDGFVNTGRGTDVSGFFHKKPKTPPPPDPADSAAGPAEPDYLADTAYESVPLAGQCVTRAGGLIIARQGLSDAPGADELLLVISLN
ncbi:MAG TPA: hypothetical protein VHB20_03840 [Verrucomicrobiae bacterium]|jgi:hypothetical protein|nr:hypothetical protein [Verrucomicrobiae bacterium]